MLSNEVFILGARHLSPGLYDRVISACDAAGFSPDVDHQAGHMMTYISLVAIGAGVSLVPASMAKAGMAGVTFVRLKGNVPYSEVSLAWSPANPSPVLARVLQLLKARYSRRGSSKALTGGASPAKRSI
jgi:DNA-binding transcriptional LysR family regulator